MEGEGGCSSSSSRPLCENIKSVVRIVKKTRCRRGWGGQEEKKLRSPGIEPGSVPSFKEDFLFGRVLFYH